MNKRVLIALAAAPVLVLAIVLFTLTFERRLP